MKGILLVLATFLFQFLPISKCFVPPSEVRLGGLFQLHRTSGDHDLASFLLAVKEINANDKILPNTTVKLAVKDTASNVGKTFFTALDMATNSFDGKGVDACIGPAMSGESDAAASVFSRFSTVSISYSATSPILSTKINYPYFARTCPSDAFQAAAMADMVANLYGWTKVSTFANSDTYGTSGINQFQNYATELGVKVLYSNLSPIGQTNFSVPIAEAMKTGTRIFVFFMCSADMGTLLSQGYAAGLFGEGTQIIAGDAAVVGNIWANWPASQVSKIMKGVIVFTPAADYSSRTGSKFLQDYLAQNSTARDPRTGLCNNGTDDDGNYLFKISSSVAKTTAYNCSGVDFSKFNPDGSEIDNYISYTYDATYAIARAMHEVLYEQRQPQITGNALFAALLNVSFNGVTGPVNFSHALTTDSTRFAEGDRRTGVRYKILNFDPAVYELSGTTGYVSVGKWTVEKGNMITTPVIFNTFDNTVPSDRPPVIILTMSRRDSVTLQCLASLMFIASAVFIAVLVLNKDSKLVRAIQFKMQCIMMLGALSSAVRVLCGHLPATDANCSASMWVGHISFWLIFLPMALKTWRVHRIVNNKTFRRIIITEKYILQLFGITFFLVIAYLTVIQSLKICRPMKITVRTQNNLQIYLDDQCSQIDSGLEIVLYIVEALLLVLTAGLCIATKNVPGALNEAQNNFQAICLVSCVGLVVFPMVYHLPDADGSTRRFISATGVFVSAFCTMSVLHGRRTALLLQHVELYGTLVGLSTGRGSLSPSTLEDDTSSPSSVSRIHIDGPYGGSRTNPFEAVKTENLLYRRKTCREQISHWQQVLRHTEALMLLQASCDEGGNDVVSDPSSANRADVLASLNFQSPTDVPSTLLSSLEKGRGSGSEHDRSMIQGEDRSTSLTQTIQSSSHVRNFGGDDRDSNEDMGGKGRNKGVLSGAVEDYLGGKGDPGRTQNRGNVPQANYIIDKHSTRNLMDGSAHIYSSYDSESSEIMQLESMKA